mgnify:CR=1 FL=1
MLGNSYKIITKNEYCRKILNKVINNYNDNININIYDILMKLYEYTKKIENKNI